MAHRGCSRWNPTVTGARPQENKTLHLFYDDDSRYGELMPCPCCRPRRDQRHVGGLAKHQDVFLRLVDPNPWFILKLRSQLSTNGVEFNARTRQRLMSSTRTDYEKNVILYQWLMDSTNDAFMKFLTQLRNTFQSHVADALMGINDDILTRETRRHLLKVSRVLTNRLEIKQSGLLAVLRSRQLLSDTDYQRLNGETVNYRRNLLLIDVLLRGSQRTWNCFVEELGKAGQMELKGICMDVAAHQGEPSIGPSPVTMSLEQFKSIEEKFLQYVSPHPLLITELVSQLSLRGEELDEKIRQLLLWSPRLHTDYEKNMLIFQWIQGSDDILGYMETFIQSLRNDKQIAAANILLTSAESDDPQQQPLSEPNHTRLIRIAPVFMEVLDFDESLLDAIISKDVLSLSDREQLKVEQSGCERSAMLIDALQRGTVRSLHGVVEAIDSHVKWVGTYLLRGEMVVIRVDCEEQQKENLENFIVAQLTAYLRSRVDSDYEFKPKLDSVLAELEHRKLRIVKVRKGNYCILAYIYCEDVSARDALTQLLTSGRLKVIFEAVYSSLGLTPNDLSVSENDQHLDTKETKEVSEYEPTIHEDKN